MNYTNFITKRILLKKLYKIGTDLFFGSNTIVTVLLKNKAVKKPVPYYKLCPEDKAGFLLGCKIFMVRKYPDTVYVGAVLLDYVFRGIGKNSIQCLVC
jgi:hypothetical protein